MALCSFKDQQKAKQIVPALTQRPSRSCSTQNGREAVKTTPEKWLWPYLAAGAALVATVFVSVVVVVVSAALLQPFVTLIMIIPSPRRSKILFMRQHSPGHSEAASRKTNYFSLRVSLMRRHAWSVRPSPSSKNTISVNLAVISLAL
jgi:hypothetical protein